MIQQVLAEPGTGDIIAALLVAAICWPLLMWGVLRVLRW